jgi:hypothetical protein
MKREVITGKMPRQKRRAQFLFNDGEFRPKKEKQATEYRRRPKNRRQNGDYDDESSYFVSVYG